MKILLVNDTRTADSNPGCSATVECLLNDLEKRQPKAEITTIPFGIGVDYFQHIYDDFPAPSFLEKVRYRLFGKKEKTKSWDIDLPPVNPDKWEKACAAFKEKESDLVSSVFDADLVIANMEGSIHHNSAIGLSIICLGKIAKEAGKKVFFTNGTVQALDKYIIKNDLSKFDFISVREPMSFRYLKKAGINVYQGADYAFKSMQFSIPTTFKGTEGSVLFTSGVLGAFKGLPGSLSDDSIKEMISRLKVQSEKLYYLSVEETEERVVKLMTEQNVEIIRMKDHKWSEIFSILEQFKYVVTGRYHIAIFAALIQKPVVILGSNSWKMEGLTELLKSPSLLQEQIPKNIDIRMESFTLTEKMISFPKSLVKNNLPETF